MVRVDVSFDKRVGKWRIACTADNCKSNALYETQELAEHFAFVHGEMKVKEHA